MVEYSPCDHVCEIHPKIIYKIEGAINYNAKLSPEAEKIFGPIRESIKQFKKEMYGSTSD